jgi:2-aminoadipate transaminase
MIIVEEPSYFLALRIFADHGLRVVSLPADEHGLSIDALEEVLFSQRPAFVYVIPTYQNPSGATLTLERRRQLVELSQEYRFLILADEVYHLLSYGAPSPPPLAAFSASRTVLSLGSFSKILAPGLRLGWVQTAPSHVQRLMTSGMLDSGGGLNPFTSGIVRNVLAAGQQDSYLDRLRAAYGDRVMTLDAALQKQLGTKISYRRPDGGYFFWLELERAIDSERLLAVAAAHKVSFRPGVRFSSRHGLRNHLRLSFAYYDNAGLVDGVTRLAAALADSNAPT